MNFGQIVERSIRLVRSQTVLWKLGLLALFTEGATGFMISGPPLPKTNESPSTSLDQFSVRFDNWALNHSGWLIAGCLLLATLLLVGWYVSLRAKAGLIIAVTELEEGRVVDGFRNAYRSGGASVWRLVGLYLVFGILVTGVLAVPYAVVGTLIDQLSQAAVVTIFVFLFPFLIAVAAYTSFITKMAERAVVLEGQSIWRALRTAHHVLTHQLGRAVIALLIELAIRILFVLLIAAIVMIAFGLAALLAYLLALILPTEILGAVIGAAVILFLAGVILLGGWFAALMTSYWTLLYRAFDYVTKKGD
jgi:hypothetical protein